jgi:hypothetical protein
MEGLPIGQMQIQARQPMHRSSSVTTVWFCSLSLAFIGQTFMQGASSQARQIIGTFACRDSIEFSRILASPGLQTPLCFIEQAISQRRQPVHFSGSMTNISLLGSMLPRNDFGGPTVH